MEPLILARSQHPISRRDIDPNVLKVLYRLLVAGYTAYLVGGSVRDLMMGRAPKDFDVATSAHPQQVRDLFRNSRLIGRRFRLVHVFFGQQNIEVATFRRLAEDVADNGDLMIRHDNTFGTPEEDAFRRDFTVNALFYDPRSFEVIDYVGGVPDLEARLIRTVGDPEVRMREDPVRMIRAVRFATKLDFTIEPATRAAIVRHSGDLIKAPAPRLVEEIFRTLSLAGAERALFLMEQLGLLEVLLPKLSHHLRESAGADPGLGATAQNLTALGHWIDRGGEPSRPLVLACLFADLHRTSVAAAGEARRLDLVGFLRERGFSRADTDHMRLLLEAATHMMNRTRIARRIVRRPYYPEARRFFELIAPVYDLDIADFDRFIAEAPGHPPHHRRVHPPATPHAGGEKSETAAVSEAVPAPEAGPMPSRRRRRHRGGRRRRRGRASPPLAPGETNLPAAAESASPGRSEDSMVAGAAGSDEPEHPGVSRGTLPGGDEPI